MECGMLGLTMINNDSSMLGIDNYEYDDMMLGGFKDVMAKGWKHFKRGGKKVLTMVPKLLDLVQKHSKIIKEGVKLIPNPTVQNLINQTIDHAPKLKQPAELLNKLLSKEKVEKELGMTYQKVKDMKLGEDINNRVGRNINAIMSNLNKIGSLNETDVKKLKRQLKYLPLLNTNKLGSTNAKTMKITGPELKAISNYATKSVDTQFGRLFLSGSTSQGALVPKFMVSAITNKSDGKKGAVKSDKLKEVERSFDSFFK